MNFLWNMLLAGVWVAVTGQFTLGNFILGFLLSYLVLVAGRIGKHRANYLRRTRAILSLVAFVAVELVRANLRLAKDIVSVRLKIKPGILAIPIDVETDAEIAVLGTLITLMPGTVCLDITDDRKFLYVHALYADQTDKLLHDIKENYERRILEILR